MFFLSPASFRDYPVCLWGPELLDILPKVIWGTRKTKPGIRTPINTGSLDWFFVSLSSQQLALCFIFFRFLF
jgi:hypothetical protein